MRDKRSEKSREEETWKGEGEEDACMGKEIIETSTILYMIIPRSVLTSVSSKHKLAT